MDGKASGHQGAACWGAKRVSVVPIQTKTTSDQSVNVGSDNLQCDFQVHIYTHIDREGKKGNGPIEWPPLALPVLACPFTSGVVTGRWNPTFAHPQSSTSIMRMCGLPVRFATTESNWVERRTRHPAKQLKRPDCLVLIHSIK